MDIEEFRSQARLTLEQVLNQLQAITLLISELEVQVSEVGGTLKTFALMVEQLTDQTDQTSPKNSSNTERLKDDGQGLDE